MECITAEEIANAMGQVLFHSDITLIMTFVISFTVGYFFRKLSERDYDDLF